MNKKSFKIVKTEDFSPLAFPIWAERIRSQTISSEKWEIRIKRMINRLEKSF